LIAAFSNPPQILAHSPQSPNKYPKTNIQYSIMTPVCPDSELLGLHPSRFTFDDTTAVWFRQHLNPPFAHILEILTFPGSALCIGILVGLVMAILTWKRNWSAMAVFFLTVPCGAMLGELIKLIVRRPRPFIAGPMGDWGGYSFPSGHTTASTLMYGFLLLSLASTLGDARRRTRAAIYLTWFAIALTIAFTRVALGAHFITDVLGAILWAICWMLLCSFVTRTARQQLDRRRQLIPVEQTVEAC
jgi:membrane-associated phospholipid phosphatase